jgi:uncharacterized protein YndB with AHSA1/START domain
MTDRSTRDFETTIEINAPPSPVWKALLEADQRTRWFSLEAAVDPRLGGRYFLGWGEAFNGGACNLAREPERRLSITWNAIMTADLDECRAARRAYRLAACRRRRFARTRGRFRATES